MECVKLADGPRHCAGLLITTSCLARRFTVLLHMLTALRSNWRSLPGLEGRHRLAFHHERETSKLRFFCDAAVGQADGIRLDACPGFQIDAAQLHDAILKEVGLRTSVRIQDRLVADRNQVVLGDIVGQQRRPGANLHAQHPENPRKVRRTYERVGQHRCKQRLVGRRDKFRQPDLNTP